MPSLVTCRCPFRLMRRCFLGMWICLLVLQGFRQVWWCCLFDYSTYIPFFGALTWRPMPTAARSKLCNSVSAWSGVFASIAVIGLVGVGKVYINLVIYLLIKNITIYLSNFVHFISFHDVYWYYIYDTHTHTHTHTHIYIYIYITGEVKLERSNWRGQTSQ